MSYPPQRYLGDAGEISAVFRPFDTEPNVVSPSGSNSYLATTPSPRASSASTAWTWVRAPRGRAPISTRPSRSRSSSSPGACASTTASAGRARAGDFLYVPVGGLHAFENGPEASSMLLLFVPGAPREEYFERLAEMAQRGGDEFAEFLVRHDSYFVDA
jgi:hypothetical protein